jgi:2-methylisocitrate lyase-like PEP mutase family enzyme
MTNIQAAKAARFRALHSGPGAFVIANAWDVGSAKALAKRGFQALATSSGASAASLGLSDGELTREQVIAHVHALANATELGLSADLENGFGDSPECVAETVRMAAAAGAVGGSIEDFGAGSGLAGARGLYDFEHAVARVAAAAEAARSLPFPFTLTARAEGFLRGRPQLEEIIARLQAFERAGADVLFAPGLPDLASVRAVCAAVTRPVNFMVGIRGKSFSVAELEAAGVRRISLAGSLYRVAMKAFADAATEVLERGTFDYLGRS